MPDDAVVGGSVLVVGASSGIGLSITDELSAAGYQVVAWSRSGHPADRAPSTAAFCPVDVRQPDAVAAALRSTFADRRRPDAVVYVAGIARWGTVGEQDTAEWQDVLATNVVGAFTVLDQFAKVF